MNLRLQNGRAMHQVVTRRPLTMEARVRPRPVYVRFMVYKVASSYYTLSPPVSIILTTLHTHIHLHVAVI